MIFTYCRVCPHDLQLYTPFLPTIRHGRVQSPWHSFHKRSDKKRCHTGCASESQALSCWLRYWNYSRSTLHDKPPPAICLCEHRYLRKDHALKNHYHFVPQYKGSPSELTFVVLFSCLKNLITTIYFFAAPIKRMTAVSKKSPFYIETCRHLIYFNFKVH
jgi:hypothetical protein